MPETTADVFFELRVKKDGESVGGESTDSQFAGMIELESFELSSRSMADMQKSEMYENMSESQGGDGQKPPTDFKHVEDKHEQGKNVFSLKITKATDCSSVAIALSYAKNLRNKEKDCFERAKLIARKRGGSATGMVFLTLLFKNVYVVNFNLNLSGGKGASGSSLPEEDIDLVFESCAMEYVQQSRTGQSLFRVRKSWNFQGKTKGDDDQLIQEFK